jgi:hypothetical protein
VVPRGAPIGGSRKKVEPGGRLTYTDCRDKAMPDDVRISLILGAERVSVQLYDGTIRDLQEVLHDVERTLTNSTPKVTWQWGDRAEMLAVASPNGVPHDALLAIVQEVQAGFESVAQSTPAQIQWPPTFGPRARQAVTRMLKRLDKVESITVAAEDNLPITIDRTTLEQGLAGRAVRGYSEFASIDGVLDLVSVRGGPNFGLEEHGTGRKIRCTVAPAALAQAKDALGKRVVVEGVVRFTRDGRAIAVSNVTKIWQRPDDTPIDRLIGSLPNFTGGVEPGEYIRRLRGDVDD